MRTPSRPAVAAALAVLVLAGCGPTSDADRRPSAAADAAPRALVSAWHRSLVGGDKERYLACFAGSKDDLVLVLAVFEAVQAAYAFHDAVVGAYGPEAWQVFQSSKGTRVDLFPRDPAWTRTITVVPMGRSAFGYLPRSRVPLHMMDEGGRWRILAAGMVPPGYEAKRAAEYLFRWAATLRKLAPKPGQEAFSAEKATREVTDEFRARVSAEDQPAAAAAVEAFMLQ